MKKYVYTQNKKKNLHILTVNGGTCFSIETDLMSTNEFLKLSLNHGLRDSRKGEQVEVWDESNTNGVVCSNCGSHNVEEKMFLNYLTGYVGSPTGEDDDTWCNDCETHSGFTTKKTKEPLLIFKS